MTETKVNMEKKLENITLRIIITAINYYITVIMHAGKCVFSFGYFVQ